MGNELCSFIKNTYSIICYCVHYWVQNLLYVGTYLPIWYFKKVYFRLSQYSFINRKWKLSKIMVNIYDSENNTYVFFNIFLTNDFKSIKKFKKRVIIITQTKCCTMYTFYNFIATYILYAHCSGYKCIS